MGSTGRVLWSLIVVALVACRAESRSALREGVTSSANAAPEAEAALKAYCEGIEGHSPAERKTYDDALSTLRTIYVNGTNGDDCAIIARKLGRLKRLQLREPADLSLLDLLPGVVELTATLAAGPAPTRLDALERRSLVHLVLDAPEGTTVPPAAAAAWAEVIARQLTLETLYVQGLPLTRLDAMSALTRLKTLHVTRAGVTDLAPLAGLERLEDLDVSGNQIADLRPVGQLLTLEKLNASDNRVRDITPVMSLANLEQLDLSNNAGIEAILAVQFLPNLRDLSVENASLTSLAPLATIPNLSGLFISGNQVEDLAPLRGHNLLSFDAKRNRIRDLSPLVGMDNLQMVLFDENPVTVFPAFAERRSLQLVSFVGTPITDWCPILTLPRVRIVRAGDGRVLTSDDQIAAERTARHCAP